jgi:DNA repair protein SbcC/Rad50
MNPLRLSLRNCRTFDQIDLDLDDGLLAIIGANGSGKSTLINAIDIALFGSRSLGSWYPRDTGEEGQLEITLMFDHGDETYRVRRTFSPKGRGQSKTDLERSRVDAIEAGGLPMEWEPMTVESQSATTDQIESLIGLSRETFRASSFLAQGETGVFCEAPPRERKRILAEIIGLADWDSHLERARTEKRAVEFELVRIAGQVETAEAELQERPLIEQERDSARAGEKEIRAALDEATARHAAAREALAEQERRAETRRNAENALQRADRDLHDLRARISAVERQIAAGKERLALQPRLQELVDTLPGLLEEQETLRVALAQWDERQRLQRDRDLALTEAERYGSDAAELLERAKHVLAHIGKDRCDRCDQILDSDAAERAAQSYRNEATQCSQASDEAREHVNLIDKALAELPREEPDRARAAKLPEWISKCHEAERALAATAEVEAQTKQHETDLEKMRAELPERETAVGTARAELEALGSHDPAEALLLGREVGTLNVELQRLPNVLREATTTVARCDERIDRLDKIAAGVTGAMTRRDELHSELTVLTNLERACGPNGVPALILETVAIPQIETEASRILSRLGGPAYAVELRTLREKKTGGIADTLDIVCLTQTGDAPYETFSGGERARIAFALRLSLAQLLANRQGSPTGLLVIDELEGLDPEGISALVDVLEDLQQQIPKIIVVSHQAELRDAFGRTLELENVDGRSRVVTVEVPA